MMTEYESIEKDEGRRYKPYLCPKGKRTIGVGWNMDDNPLPPYIQAYLDAHGRITDEHINELLEISVRRATSDCRVLFPDFNSFSPARRVALINWMFQHGFYSARGYKKSVKLINTGQWAEAAKEMQDSAWYRADSPARAKRITKIIREG